MKILDEIKYTESSALFYKEGTKLFLLFFDNFL